MEGIVDTLQKLLNWPVLIYFLIIVAAFFLPEFWFGKRRQRIARQRQQAGLPSDRIVSTADTLSQVQFEVRFQSMFFVLAVIVSPMLIVFVTVEILGLDEKITEGLGLAFVGMFLWSLTQGTDVAKAFLGGLSFRTLIAFRRPFQVGDRVTLKGHSGKVLSIGTFFVMLQTPNDDLVSIPTRDLWVEVLVSANAGNRSSLCVMEFFLASFATRNERQQAEDIIWEAIQTSPYFEVSKPLQIYLSQTREAIVLTAKAYVASTYNEFLFKSDVTQAFLNYAIEHQLPLATRQRRDLPIMHKEGN